MTSEATPGEQPPPRKLERARRDPLASPALGTASSDLIEPCAVRDPLPAVPPPAPDGALALAFSGGGFRATLAALGVLRFLADGGLLHRVRYLSSVSGGSLANGLLAGHWRELDQEGFSAAALDRIVIEPFVERISNDSLIWKLVANVWRIVGPRTRTHLLADCWTSGSTEGRCSRSFRPSAVSSSTPPT